MGYHPCAFAAEQGVSTTNIRIIPRLHSDSLSVREPVTNWHMRIRPLSVLRQKKGNQDAGSQRVLVQFSSGDGAAPSRRSRSRAARPVFLAHSTENLGTNKNHSFARAVAVPPECRACPPMRVCPTCRSLSWHRVCHALLRRHRPTRGRAYPGEQEIRCTMNEPFSPPLPPRLSTGIAGFDALLSGGFLRGGLSGDGTTRCR